MSLTTLLVLADGRLPAGGHAHSGGLEEAVAAGRVADLPSLDGFLRGRLATAGTVAAAFAAATCCSYVVDGAPRLSDPTGLLAPPSAGRGWSGLLGPQQLQPQQLQPQQLQPQQLQPQQLQPQQLRPQQLDDGLDARTPSPALRKASRVQGRALLRAGRAIWGVPANPALGREPHHPIALGTVAAAAGLTPKDAATAAAYGSLTGPATAAVRLLGLDPYGVHALLAALADECDRIAGLAATHAHDPVDELPAGSAPLLDIGAEHHATWEVRLFAS